MAKTTIGEVVVSSSFVMAGSRAFGSLSGGSATRQGWPSWRCFRSRYDPDRRKVVAMLKFRASTSRKIKS
jgi:hypothetical protein